MRVKDKPPPRPTSPRDDDDEGVTDASASLEASAALDDGQATLDDHAIFSRVPAHMTVGADAGDAGAYADVTGRDATAGFVRVGRGRHMSVDAGLDGGAWAELTRGTAGGAGHTGVYYQPGWAEMWHEVDWASGGGVNRAGAVGIVSAEELGLGFSVGRTVGDVTGYGLFAVLGRANRELTDLGPTSLNGEPARRVELRTASGKSLLARPGLGFAHFGIGGQLSVRKDKDVVLRAALTEDAAKSALGESKGVLGYFRDKARAAGVASEPVPIPDLTKPEELAAGDEMVVSTSGSVSGGVFVGALAGIGAQALVQGDFELAVKKHDDDRVELAVTPRKIKGGQVRAGAALLLDIDRAKFSADAFRQSFVFDLKDPAAKAAYLKALEGDLPGAWPEGKELPDHDDGQDPLETRFHDAIKAEELPSGVKRTFVELLDVERKQSGWGLGFGVWRRGAAFIGLGRDTLDTRTTRTRVSSRHAGRAHTRSVESRRYTLISGIETEGVHASLRRRTVFDDDGTPHREFTGLALEARIHDTKVRGGELNDDFIRAVRETFGIDLPDVDVEGTKQAREVRLGRVLSAADLEALSSANIPGLELAGTPVEKAEAVQDFIAEEGLPGFGLLHRALGGDIELETTAAVYDDALDGARTLVFRFEHKLPPDKERLKARLKEVEGALSALEDARAIARVDPFVDDNAALVREIDQAAASLAKTLDVSHLSTGERLALADALERGWTTALERRCIELLVPTA
jgi:hypothetical protein